MGATMSLSAAILVVKSMVETQIKSRLNGIRQMSVIHPSEIMSLPIVSNAKAKPSAEIVPLEIITEQIVTTMNAQVMHEHLIAYETMHGEKTGKPSDKEGCRNALIKLIL
jgi:hypothetical protein